VNLATYGAAVDVADAASAAASAAGKSGRSTGRADWPRARFCRWRLWSWPRAMAWRRIFESYRVAAVVNAGRATTHRPVNCWTPVEGVAAEEILLLPNNPNVVLAAARLQR